jgi:hypothetical protein
MLPRALRPRPCARVRSRRSRRTAKARPEQSITFLPGGRNPSFRRDCAVHAPPPRRGGWYARTRSNSG